MKHATAGGVPSPLLDVVRSGQSYLAVGGPATGRIWRAADISVEMSEVHQVGFNIGPELSGVALDGDRVVAVGTRDNMGVVCTSTDGGKTWTTEARLEVFGLKYSDDYSGAMSDVMFADGHIIAVGRLGDARPTVWIGEWND